MNIGNFIFLEFLKTYLYKPAQNIYTDTPLGPCLPTCPFYPEIVSKLKISLAFLMSSFGPYNRQWLFCRNLPVHKCFLSGLCLLVTQPSRAKAVHLNENGQYNCQKRRSGYEDNTRVAVWISRSSSGLKNHPDKSHSTKKGVKSFCACLLLLAHFARGCKTQANKPRTPWACTQAEADS